MGPAGLLQAYRFIADSRDEATAQRLRRLRLLGPLDGIPYTDFIVALLENARARRARFQGLESPNR